MNLMISPSEKTGEGSLSPKNIAQLEIPTLERLLPIGQYGTDGISALVDKVREVLTIPAINHLKHDNLDKSEVSMKSAYVNWLIIHVCIYRAIGAIRMM